MHSTNYLNKQTTMKKLSVSVIINILFVASFLGLPKNLLSQGVGIGTNTPDASTALGITHTAKGLLLPGMSTAFS